MATYKELHGIAVKNSSTDPTATGEIFYNTTALATGATGFKTVVSSSAWFAQSPTTTQHGDGAGCGPTTACVIWTGYSPDAPPVTNATEEFNGTGWNNGGNYPFSGFNSTGAAGTLTAALGMGGRNAPPAGTSSNVTAEYDGTSWTTGNNTPDARYGLAGIGSQTAAVGFGGNNRADAGPSNPDGSGTRADTFEYDGTNWTTGNNYPISVMTAGSCGSQTAAVTGGGSDRTDGSGVNTSCTYDGTNWTAVSNINTARGAVRQSGNQTSALLFGPGTQTESWDGSSWTTAPSLAGAGYGGSSGHNNNPAGNTSALLAARRDGSNYPKNTEEFAVATTVTTPGAWASSGALNTGRTELMGAGTVDAALAVGGYQSPGSGTIANAEEYNGSSWSNATAMPAAKHKPATGGIQTAAFVAGGYPGNAGNVNTYEYDGTNWTNGGNLNTSRRALRGSGTLPAGLAIGGYADPPGSPLANVEEYDGTNWANGGVLPTATANIGAAGTQTATVAFGGGAPSITTNAYHYDGSSWTATGSMNTAKGEMGCGGIQTSALSFGGSTPSASTGSEAYNGTSWVTSPSLATARKALGAAQATPSNATGLAFGGSPPGSGMTTTEEFTGETTAANVKTITTS